MIILDMGSSPTDLSHLPGWALHDPRILYLSFPNRRPAESLNIALASAVGDLIGWLTADDCYVPGALKRAVDAFSRQPQPQMVYGHAQHIDAHGCFLGFYPTIPPSVGLAGFQENCFVCPPSVVLCRSFLQQVGGFNPQWSCAFDLDLLLRIFHQVPDAIGFIDQVQVSTRLHAATIMANQQLRVNLKCAQLLHRTAGTVAPHLLETAARALVAAHPKANAKQDRRFLEVFTRSCWLAMIVAASSSASRITNSPRPRSRPSGRSFSRRWMWWCHGRR